MISASSPTQKGRKCLRIPNLHPCFSLRLHRNPCCKRISALHRGCSNLDTTGLSSTKFCVLPFTVLIIERPITMVEGKIHPSDDDERPGVSMKLAYNAVARSQTVKSVRYPTHTMPSMRATRTGGAAFFSAPPVRCKFGAMHALLFSLQRQPT